MKLWNKARPNQSLFSFIVTMILILVSIMCGFLAFGDTTMNLRMAFYALMGLLVAIALK